ncbi:MAG TPA: transglycosylase domain-containing protein [Streptomyces sp.]
MSHEPQPPGTGPDRGNSESVSGEDLQSPAPDGPSPAAAAESSADGGADRAVKPGRRTKRRRKRRKRTGWRRAVPTWRMTLGAFLLFVLLVTGALIAGYQLIDIPSANAAANAQANVYLYKDGSVIARDGEINREKVSLAQIPRTVQHAVLAAEDRDFYSEHAVDIKAMFRAGWNTVTGKGKQGGSTITQQYVKNYYLGQEQTFVRKAKELIISVKLDRQTTKDEIFEGYLNTSYFGRNAYGIQAAAQAYYGKNVTDLDTGEGAYLASLLNAPSAYDVVVRPENKSAAVARWHYVLNGMVKEGWLDAARRDAMRFPVPGEAKPANALSGQRGYLVHAIGDYLGLHNIIDESTLATGGYRITTTLDKRKQDALVKAVQNNVLSRTSDDRKADRDVRVGAASIDPATGRVLALYGGIDYTRQYVNNATRRDYQVGSTFKPFVLAAALDNNAVTQDGKTITPNTRYDGTNRRTVEGFDSTTPYAPANEDNRSYGHITVREATDKSVNAVYAQLAQDTGPGLVKSTAIRLGIPAGTPDLTASPSIALGPATASVLDMTEAYATLANHGRHRAHVLVSRISKNGTDLALPARSTEQAISREAADTTTSVLQGVVEGGTATAAQAVNRPAAGKTGTAEDDRAAWFAGYTPDLATVVAVMGQNPDTGEQTPLYGALGLGRINGGGAPAETWAAYTAVALESSAVKDFDLNVPKGSEESASPVDESGNPIPDESDDPSDDPSGDTSDDTSYGGIPDDGIPDPAWQPGPTPGETPDSPEPG